MTAVPTRLVHLAVDSAESPSIARFWADLLGWSVTYEDDDESYIENAAAPTIGLSFGPVPEPKAAKNRIHLDLASSSATHQDEQVTKALDLGARRIAIGQGDVPWVVLGDPEGNEFCVLDPRPEYAATGSLAAIVLDSHDPAGIMAFWSAAAGWPVFQWNAEFASLRPPAPGTPWLEVLRVPEPKTVKNRIHLEVAPYAGEDHTAEVARLTGLGARPADVGQGDVPWVVLADPQDNEFCVLTPRADRQAEP